MQVTPFVRALNGNSIKTALLDKDALADVTSPEVDDVFENLSRYLRNSKHIPTRIVIQTHQPGDIPYYWRFTSHGM